MLKSELEARVKLLEKYVDHLPTCQRATIHRAHFTDKYPCTCGFDDLGVELVFTPIRTMSKKYLPSSIKRKNLTA